MRKSKTNLRLKHTFSIVILFCSLFAAYEVQAKGGILTGAVLASSDGSPLPGVTVHVVSEADTSLGHYTFTNSKGKYKFVNLTPGKYSVTYSLLGYVSIKKETDVSDAESTTLNVQLSEQPLNSEDVVITASRHEEKITHAPASISVVPSTVVREHVTATPTDILATVPGIDVSREGIAMATYSSRSMHSVFGSDMLTMNDYHSMEVPAIGGFYGILMPQVPDDIDHVEVIRGPGSALYGPDAATGVVHFISRSPFASQGTNISFAGGERSYIDGAFRHAQALSDKFAFKISGHYLRANDWPIADDPKEDTARKNAQAALVSTPAGPQRDSLARIGSRDYTLELYSFEGRADAVFSDDMTLNLTGGLTNIANDVALTEDFGAAQIKNWMYDYVQGRLNYKDLFVQGDINHNDTKDSYFLPTGAKVSDHSTTYSVQLQHHYTPWTNEQLTYGADFRAIRPNTDSTLYGPEDGHANVSILGAYLQSQTSLLDSTLDLVLAGRVDKLSDPSDQIQKPIFSPRAAAVYHLDRLNLVRAMYNETYLLPSENRMFADIVFSTDIYGFGSEGLPLQYATTARFVSPYVAGTSFIANGDGSYNMYSKFSPGAPIRSNTAAGALWPALAQLAGGKLASSATLQTLLGASGVAALESVLQNMNAPTPQQVSTYLAYINLNSASNTTMPILPTAAPLDISGVQPQ